MEKFICYYCNTSFTAKKNLIRHVKFRCYKKPVNTNGTNITTVSKINVGLRKNINKTPDSLNIQKEYHNDQENEIHVCQNLQKECYCNVDQTNVNYNLQKKYCDEDEYNSQHGKDHINPIREDDGYSGI